MTFTVVPATVIAAVREDVPVLALIMRPTAPLPVNATGHPLPPGISIQLTLLQAVQLQLLPVATLRVLLNVPPLAGTLMGVVGVTWKPQIEGSCVIP